MDTLIKHFVQMVQQVRITMITLFQLFHHLVIGEDDCGKSFHNFSHLVPGFMIVNPP